MNESFAEKVTQQMSVIIFTNNICTSVYLRYLVFVVYNNFDSNLTYMYL